MANARKRKKAYHRKFRPPTNAKRLAMIGRVIAAVDDPLDPDLPRVIALHNQGMRFNREEIAVDRAVGDPDDASLTISRARANPPHLRLYRRGVIDLDQYQAAERYADWCQIESGGSGGGGDLSGVRSPNVPTGSITDAQLHATTELRELYAALGPSLRVILSMFVLGGMQASEIAPYLDRNETKVQGQIEAALTRAAEHMGIGDSSKRPQSSRRPPQPKRTSPRVQIKNL